MVPAFLTTSIPTLWKYNNPRRLRTIESFGKSLPVLCSMALSNRVKEVPLKRTDARKRGFTSSLTSSYARDKQTANW
jgi:hypothetical protein